MDRDFYAEIRNVVEDWLASGASIDDIEEQMDSLIGTVGEE